METKGDRLHSEELTFERRTVQAPEPHCRAGRQSPAMLNGPCRMHGGTSPGAPKGNGNAKKHGLYTTEAIAERRQIAALVRRMRGLVGKVDRQR